MRRVIVESPLRPQPPHSLEDHLAYARRASRDCIARGEAPLAGHILHTQYLSDECAPERVLGMEATWAWTLVADAVVVYDDYGISPGMLKGIEIAKQFSIPVEYRRLYDEVP